MTYNKIPRTVLAPIFLTIAVALAGCSGLAPGALGQNQQLLASCPTDGRLATLIDDDETGSRVDPVTTERDQSVIKQEVIQTAVCNGRLTVDMFSSSSGSTATVYDESIDLPGATDNARLVQVPTAVKKIMKQIRANWAPALATLPQDGTDIAGLYRLAGEYNEQLAAGTSFNWVMLTDGFNNLSSIDLDTQALSPGQAQVLAAQVPVPNLKGASITVVGLGRVAGSPAPSAVIDGLVAFYNAVCRDTHAAKCLSVTDWK